jgi:hypothetical protein
VERFAPPAAGVLALALALAALPPAAAETAPAVGDPRGAVFRLSDDLDLCEEARVRLAASGSGLMAVWESDHDRALYPQSRGKAEIGWGAQFDGRAWSEPFVASYAAGGASQAHRGSVAGAHDHYLTAYNLEQGGVGAARFRPGAALPEASWSFGRIDYVTARPSPAEVAGTDFAAVVSTDPAAAGAGKWAAVALALGPGAAAAEGRIADFSPGVLVDVLLFNWSGSLAAVLEVEPEPAGPHALLLAVLGEGGWAAPVPVEGAAGALSSAAAAVAVEGGRAILAYERQRAPEAAAASIVVAVLARNGSTREVVATPRGGSHTHGVASIAAMGGRTFVAWVTDDDALGGGGDVDAYYREVDPAAGALGPVRPLNPPDGNASDGDAAIASDGRRLFGAWVTDNPAYTDGLDPDVVARYLEGDYDLDGLLDEDDPDPVHGALPPDGRQGTGSGAFAAAAAGTTAAAGAAAVWVLRKRRAAR